MDITSSVQAVFALIVRNPRGKEILQRSMQRFLSEKLKVSRLRELLQAFRITRPLVVGMGDMEEPKPKRPRVEEERESDGEGATGGAKRVR